jgi:hypothetical protein
MKTLRIAEPGAGAERRRSGRARATAVACAAAAMFAAAPAWALDLSSVSRTDAAAGVKATLERGAAAAVTALGATDGFLGNPRVRIPLPDGLKQAQKVMQVIGRQQQFDDLVVGINRAAEAAMPQARPLLMSAIQTMTVSDAKAILSGGDDSVTRFFQSRTEQSLMTRFLPIVRQTTAQAGLARQYNSLAGQAASYGVIKEKDATIESYVAAKAMSGLFLMIAEQERAIRRDPAGTGSAVLRKVFGGG